MTVLRGAGYAQHALWVARQAGEPDWVLDVLLDDLHDYGQALEFLTTLSRCARTCVYVMRCACARARALSATQSEVPPATP